MDDGFYFNELINLLFEHFLEYIENNIAILRMVTYNCLLLVCKY